MTRPPPPSGRLRPIVYRKSYTTGDVARLIGCAPRTAQQLIDRGAIVGFHLNHDRRVAHADLRAFLASQEGMRYALEELDRAARAAGVAVPGDRKPGNK